MSTIRTEEQLRNKLKNTLIRVQKLRHEMACKKSLKGKLRVLPKLIRIHEDLAKRRAYLSDNDENKRLIERCDFVLARWHKELTQDLKNLNQKEKGK